MIPRPQNTEAAPYYFTYIDQVAGDLSATLEGQLDAPLEILAAVPEEASLRRYAPDKWSMREVLNHISDTERVLAVRALWFARGFDSPLPSFDQHISASGAVADRVSW